MFFNKPKKKKGVTEYIRTVDPPPSLILAIEKRQIITFIYDDYFRIVEPHACGVLSNGRCVLIGYQTGGQSQSESDPPWRTFSVEKIHDLQSRDDTFSTNRPDYNPNDSRLNPVYARV